MALELLPAYKIELLNKGPANENLIQYYDDLDGDNISEKIEYQQFMELKTSVLVYSDNKIIKQAIYNGLSGNVKSVITSDVDNDGFKDIVLFTIYNDSIFISITDPYSEKDIAREVAICPIHQANGSYQYEIQPVEPVDVNLDGYKEIVFTVITGFNIKPRGLFVFYPFTGQIKQSETGCALLSDPALTDLNDDGSTEIFADIMVPGNCDSSLAFSDYFGWLMVFNNDLSFLFTPVAFPAAPASTRVIPVITDSARSLMVIHNYLGSGSFESFIGLYDLDGKIVKKEIIAGGENMDGATFFSFDNSESGTFLIKVNGEVLGIDTDLKFRKVKNISSFCWYQSVKKIDLDNDKEKEVLMVGDDNNSIHIYRNDLNDKVSVNFQENLERAYISLRRSAAGESNLVVDTQRNIYFYKYHKSFFHRFWYLNCILIFLVSNLVYYTSVKIAYYRKLQRDHIRNKISELQLKSVINQIDPHFTFNLMESFGSLINDHDILKAEYVFNKYSGLLKTTVLNGDKVFVTLKEELDFVRSYVDLEIFRYGNRFSYEVNIQEDTDLDMIIPKMLLHIFVENSIKHGLKHRLDNAGLLKIFVNNRSHSCIIEISDNGIGRLRSKEIDSFSSGKGLIIMNQMLELYSDLKQKKITYLIEDLFPESEMPGTRVIINIPN